MSRLLILAILISAGLTGPVLRADESSCWRVDKRAVTEGGCVTILLTGECADLKGVELIINDRLPTRLLGGLFPTIQRFEAPGGIPKTFVLVYQDLRTDYMGEPVVDEPDEFRMLPVFRGPEPVRLTLRKDAQSLGHIDIKVAPAKGRARAAAEILYPVFVKNQGPKHESGKVVSLVAASAGTIYSHHAALAMAFADEIETIRAHPDWDEIFGALAALCELRLARDEVLRTLTPQERRLPIDNFEVSESVYETLDRQMTSFYAKVCENGAFVRRSCALVRWRGAMAWRRGIARWAAFRMNPSASLRMDPSAALRMNSSAVFRIDPSAALWAVGRLFWAALGIFTLP